MTINMIMSMNKGAFLAYFNDFLTIEYFAEYHNWHITKAKKVINKGRIVHNEQVINDRSK